MRKQQARLKLQSQISSAGLYKVFSIFFAGLFFAIVLLILFNNRRTMYGFSKLGLLSVAVVAIPFLWLIMRLFSSLPKLSKGWEIAYVISFFVIFIFLQVAIGWQMRVQIDNSWDFGKIYLASENYILNGIVPEAEFFETTGSNFGMYFFWCMIFAFLKMLGISNFYIPAFIINILSISLSVLLLYLCSRQLFGSSKAMLSLLLAAVTPIFALYVPVFFTDTLTLPFTIAGILFWINIRKKWREGETGDAILYFCLMSLVLAVGSLIKTTVAIVWIAIALDLIILLCGKKRFLVLLSGAVVFSTIYFGAGYFVSHNKTVPIIEKESGIPAVSRIMMGLKGDGSYNEEDDVQLVLNSGNTYDERKEFVKDEIERRFSDMGFIGYIGHLGNKLSYTFGDGTYSTAEKLNKLPVNNSVFSEVFLLSGKYFKYWAYFCFALQIAMFFWIAMGAVSAFRRKNNALTFIRLALFGLTLALLIWESKSRYLTNFMPLFILCLIEFLPVAKTFKASEPLSKKPIIKIPYIESGETNTEPVLYKGSTNIALQEDGKVIENLFTEDIVNTDNKLNLETKINQRVSGTEINLFNMEETNNG